MLAMLVLLACAQAPKPGAAAQAPLQPEGPPGLRVALTDGQLFVPEGYRPRGGNVTLFLHLHGAAWAAERNLVRSGKRGVLVTVVLPGLSDAYARKFRDAQVFPRILDEAIRQLEGLGVARQPQVTRVVVTSFSAGFGGVRELLAQPGARERIGALVLADTLYAGFTGDPAQRQVNPEHMAPFVEFAREAVRGRKQLILSHSQLLTPTYASTVDTADYLLAQLGLRREAAADAWPGGELKLLSRCRNGRFELYGFAGETGAEHMKHLHALWTLMARLRI